MHKILLTLQLYMHYEMAVSYNGINLSGVSAATSKITGTWLIGDLTRFQCN